ncbi:hypothetical protein GFC01_08835 [Desulfofundulus thermobenzoicus]|uniref:DUF1640 domain-containing protein n=2 Tax=Desulfofundulus thermobenzoicus TaxID=29376 RepID=A0A6N7ISD8_9FIRM|nr:hypothetical protein [Desulfofundulus thermobenzoicus]
MPEEAIREMAATSEQPPGNEPPRHLVSQEFFFLLQRIDRLDEKFTERIDRLRTELRQEMGDVKQEISSLRFWTIGAVITVIAGFIGTIVTLAIR